MSTPQTVRTYHHPRIGQVRTWTAADEPNVVWLRSEALEAGLIAVGFLRPPEEAKIIFVKSPPQVPQTQGRCRAGEGTEAGVSKSDDALEGVRIDENRALPNKVYGMRRALAVGMLCPVPPCGKKW